MSCSFKYYFSKTNNYQNDRLLRFLYSGDNLRSPIKLRKFKSIQFNIYFFTFSIVPTGSCFIQHSQYSMVPSWERAKSMSEITGTGSDHQTR